MKSKIAIALAMAAPMLLPDQPALAQTCSYNNPTTSFGASYSNNAQSATASLATKLSGPGMGGVSFIAPVTAWVSRFMKRPGWVRPVRTFWRRV